MINKDLIKKLQLGMLAFYDCNDPMLDIFIKIKEAVRETIIKVLEKSRYIKVTDLIGFKKTLREKLRKKINYIRDDVSCYWVNVISINDFFDITKNFHINVRLIIKEDLVVKYSYESEQIF